MSVSHGVVAGYLTFESSECTVTHWVARVALRLSCCVPYHELDQIKDCML